MEVIPTPEKLEELRNSCFIQDITKFLIQNAKTLKQGYTCVMNLAGDDLAEACALLRNRGWKARVRDETLQIRHPSTEIWQFE
jgi:hypothetical protein